MDDLLVNVSIKALRIKPKCSSSISKLRNKAKWLSIETDKHRYIALWSMICDVDENGSGQIKAKNSTTDIFVPRLAERGKYKGTRKTIYLLALNRPLLGR